MPPLSASQVAACVIIERVSSSISIIGILMMFIGYFTIKRFRTLLSNRLLIYASVANLACNAAYLIGGASIIHESSSLCQAQAFLLEWLMQTDPLFGACMAIDVYLVMFRRWNHRQVKDVFKWYPPLCYGLPLIPALVCLLYRNEEHGDIYGNSGIWCWINSKYSYVRIYSYYGPIWIYSMVTITIYIRVGMEIFSHRTALRRLGVGRQSQPNLILQSCSRLGCSRRPNSGVSIVSSTVQACTCTRMTEFEVTCTQNSLTVPTPTHPRPLHNQEVGDFIQSTANERGLRRWLLDFPQGWYDTLHRFFEGQDQVTVAYCKCAGLFALSIMITWVPSSANRVYSLIHTNDPSFALNFAAATVLPLQGFWNTVIFFWTSWSRFEAEYHERRRVCANKRNRATCSPSQLHMVERGQRGINNNNSGDTESTREVLDDVMEITSMSDNTRNSSVRTVSEREISQ